MTASMASSFSNLVPSSKPSAFTMRARGGLLSAGNFSKSLTKRSGAISVPAKIMCARLSTF